MNDPASHDLRSRRVESWQHRRALEGGDPREWELTRYRTASLTPLGRKLLGLDLWETPVEAEAS